METFIQVFNDSVMRCIRQLQYQGAVTPYRSGQRSLNV